MRAALERSWYREGGGWWFLIPLGWLYGLGVAIRRSAYARGWLKCTRMPVPVLMVGNITVGGSGKTPLVVAIMTKLKARGIRAGVVSRGYGGHALSYPCDVTAATPAAEAGDEPAMLALKMGAPIVVDPNRVGAARRLVEHHGVGFIVSDDGLQHYALQRDAEIAVTDARRGLGNRRLLPAGPLREPPSRLASVDLVLEQGVDADYALIAGNAIAIADQRPRRLASFAGECVHAVAGIGDPERFFAMLEAAGLRVIRHPMPDHHGYRVDDIEFDDERAVLMTDKDAIKCLDFVDHRHWRVPVDVVLDTHAEQRLDALIDRLIAGASASRPVS